MRRICLAVVAAAALLTHASGQQAKKKIDPRILSQLNDIAKRITATRSSVVEVKGGGFKRQRMIANDVRARPEESQFADKPYMARITWNGQLQESKIYSDQAKAEKGEWFKLDSPFAGGHYTATYWWANKRWELEEVKRHGGRPLAGFSQPDKALGPGDPWHDLLTGKAPAKAKAP